MFDPSMTTDTQKWVVEQFGESGDYAEGVRSAARAALNPSPGKHESVFKVNASTAFICALAGGIDPAKVKNLFIAIAKRNHVANLLSAAEVEALLDEEIDRARKPDAIEQPASAKANGHPYAAVAEHDDGPWVDDAPPVVSLGDFGLPAEGTREAATEGTAEPIAQAAFTTPPMWPDEPPPRVSWIAHNLIPRGDVSTLGGDGGSGKTMAALQLSAAVARGAQDWLGAVIEPGPVVFLSAEEPQDEIRRRLARIADRQGFKCGDLKDLHFWFPSDFADCTFATPGPGGVMQATPLFRQIEAKIGQLRPSLVTLDNVAAVFAGNQNDRVMVRTFVNLFRGMARATGAAVLLLDHPSLSGLNAGTGRGGNMDWRNSVRSALHLKAAEDKADADRGVRVLEHVKSNYAPLASPLNLEWIDGVLTVEGTASPLQRAAQDAQADDKFLELLAQHVRLGIDVEPSEGRNYAPKVFAASPESGGYKSRGFAAVMHPCWSPAGSRSRKRDHRASGASGS